MSAFKGADWLRAVLPNDSSSESDEEEVPVPPAPDLNARCLTNYQRWLRDYETELAELYRNYVSQGVGIFGPAFNQVGTYKSFTNYVYRTMQPGADNLTGQ